MFHSVVVTANPLPPFKPIPLHPLLSFQPTQCNYIHKSPLWSSSRPPDCQFQPQNLSTDTFSVRVQTVSVWPLKCATCAFPLMSSFLILSILLTLIVKLNSFISATSRVQPTALELQLKTTSTYVKGSNMKIPWLWCNIAGKRTNTLWKIGYVVFRANDSNPSFFFLFLGGGGGTGVADESRVTSNPWWISAR